MYMSALVNLSLSDSIKKLFANNTLSHLKSVNTIKTTTCANGSPAWSLA